MLDQASRSAVSETSSESADEGVVPWPRSGVPDDPRIAVAAQEDPAVLRLWLRAVIQAGSRGDERISQRKRGAERSRKR